jgi:hypothetical protein
MKCKAQCNLQCTIGFNFDILQSHTILLSHICMSEIFAACHRLLVHTKCAVVRVAWLVCVF